MSQYDDIVQTLKSFIRKRGLTYKDLAKRLNLSHSSVKRIFSDQNFTLERLVQICKILDIEVAELFHATKRQDITKHELTLAQEQFLANNPSLFILFYLLLNEWHLNDILAHYHLKMPQLIARLVQLDKQGLIVLQPGNQVKLLIKRPVQWIKNGPILEKYAKKIQAEL